MAYPDDLPTCVDGSLGREKVDTGLYTNKDESADAGEYNEIKSSVEGICAILGLPNARNIPAAIATAVTKGTELGATTLTTNTLIPATSWLTVINGTGLYCAFAAQTAASVRLLYLTAGNSLVPDDYPAAVHTINGTADIVTFPHAGLYTVEGNGSNAWTVRRAADDALHDLRGTHAAPSGSDNFAAGWERGSIIIDSSSDVWICTGDGVWATLTPDLNFIPNTTGAVTSTLIGDYEVGDAKIRQGIATSVIGRSVGSSGQVGDIQAAADDRLFARVSGVLQFVQLTIGMVADRLLTWAKMPAVAAHSLVARSANSSGDASDLTIGTDEGVFNVAGVLTSQKAQTANIADSAITFAKLAQAVKNGLDPTGRRSVSGNITIDADDNVLMLTASADITLPAAADGRCVVVKKATATALTVNIVRAGSEKIENVAATYAATSFNSALYVAMTLYCDGTDWWIL